MCGRLLIAAMLASAGCGGSVVFDEDDEPLTVGSNGRVDPESTCNTIVSRYEALDCRGTLTHEVDCERWFREANERGCVGPTLAFFNCAMRSCDACYMVAEACEWECDSLGEARNACFLGEPASGGGGIP